MAIGSKKNFKVGITVDADTAKAIRGLEGVSGAVNRINGVVSKLAIGAGALTTAITVPLMAGASAAIKMYAEVENAQLAFESFLGSAAKAKKLWGELVDYASKSPLPLNQLRGGAQLLLAFGHGVDEIIPKIKLLGTVTKALDLQGGMGQAVRALEDLRAGSFNMMQLGNLGITRAALAQRGVAFSASGSLASTGEEAYTAAMELLEEKYGEMADKADQLLSTRLGNIIDNIRNKIAPALGEALAPAVGRWSDRINEVLDKLVKAFDNPEVRRAVKDSFEQLLKLAEPALKALERLADQAANDPRSFAESIRRAADAVDKLIKITVILIGASVGMKLLAWLTSAKVAVNLLTAAQVFNQTINWGGTWKSIIGWLAKASIAIRLNVASMTLLNTASLASAVGIGALITAAALLINHLMDLRKQTLSAIDALRGLRDEQNRIAKDEAENARRVGKWLAGKPKDERESILSAIEEKTGIKRSDPLFMQHLFGYAREHGGIDLQHTKSPYSTPEDADADGAGTTTTSTGVAGAAIKALEKRTDQEIILAEAMKRLGTETGMAEDSCAHFAGQVLESASDVEGLGDKLKDGVVEIEAQIREMGFKRVSPDQAGAGDIALWTPGATGDKVNHMGFLTSDVSALGEGKFKFGLVSGRGSEVKKETLTRSGVDFYRAPSGFAGGIDIDQLIRAIEEYERRLAELDTQIADQRYKNRLAGLKGLEKLNADEDHLLAEYSRIRQERDAEADPLKRKEHLLELTQIEGDLDAIERERMDTEKELFEEYERTNAKIHAIIEQSRLTAIAREGEEREEKRRADQEWAAAYISGLNELVSFGTDRILNPLSPAASITAPAQSEFNDAARMYQWAGEQVKSLGLTQEKAAAYMEPFIEKLKAAAAALADATQSARIFASISGQVSQGNYGGAAAGFLNEALGSLLGKGQSLTASLSSGITSALGASAGGPVGAAIGGLVDGFLNKGLNKVGKWFNKLFGKKKEPPTVNGVPAVWVTNFEQLARGFTLPSSAIFSGRYGNNFRVSVSGINVTSNREAADQAGEKVASAIYRALEAGA